MQDVDIQKPDFLFSCTVAIGCVYHNWHAAIPDCWMLLQSTPLTSRIKPQMLTHMVQTDIPMAIIGHVDFNHRAIKLKRKAIGDFCHDVLLVLYFRRWKVVRLSIFYSSFSTAGVVDGPSTAKYG